MRLLIYLPKDKKKSPVFLAYNFKGNHSVNSDPAILIGGKKESQLSQEELKSDKLGSRGSRSSRWAIDTMIGAGYGLVTIDYNDVDPDNNDFSDGIHSLFYKSGQTAPEKNEWGSLSAWAWGMSKAMDYLETEPLVDSKKVILFGKDRSLFSSALAEHAPHIQVVEVDPPSDYELNTDSNSFMEEIIGYAQSFAVEGDTVLLAPACASMDQFASYADRGDRFADAVRKALQ